MSGRLSTFCLCVFCLSSFVSEVCVGDDSRVDPTRFEVTELAAGLTQPMELAVASDGTVFFIELAGKLKRFDPQTRRISVAGELTVTTDQENGLIGMALDPDFSRNGWIYFQYSPPSFSGQHISRFTIKNGSLDLTSEKVLLKYEEQRKECCHHAGSLHFGPHNELFIASGDNTHPHGDSQGYAPLDERPDRAPWDAQKSAANTNSYNGKILRIRPTPDGSYEIPDGNLFPKDGSQGRPEIYVMGCRNPWRMTVDSATGFVYWGEVGPDAGSDGPRGPRGYDEFNQARHAGNFGWPYFIANNQPYAKVDFATGEAGKLFDLQAPENLSPNNTGARILPPPEPALIYYPYGESKEFPELGSGGRSACAGPVYHYSSTTSTAFGFPAAFDGSLFIYEWTRHWIKVVHFDDDYRVRSIEPFMAESRFVRPVDMVFSPEGSLYVLEYGETWGINADARLIRIDYVSGNRSPIAVASAENNLGQCPLEVRLSSQGSSDKDTDDELSFEWRLVQAADSEQKESGTSPDSGRVITVSRDPMPVLTINEPGIYNAELIVTDSHGASRSASVPVLAGNARPAIRIARPQQGDFFEPNVALPYEIVVDDDEDGTNDDHRIDENDAEPIDPEAPGRVSLNAVFTREKPLTGNSAPDDRTKPAGFRRMKASDCFNCHAVDQKRVGPPLVDIANKYRNVSGAADLSIQRVLKGSTGAWGKIPMIPHTQHTIDEIREMVAWIYSLEPAGAMQVLHGFTGEVPAAAAADNGYLTLEASYMDRGVGRLPPLTSSTVIQLRSRLIEAEHADEIRGPKIMDSKSASGEKFVGAVDHNSSLRINNITLDQVRRLTFQVASAGAGGNIEVRLDREDGDVIAQAEVEVNGEWEKWYERSVDIPAVSGSHDVFIRFVNSERTGGLMNLDSIYFGSDR